MVANDNDMVEPPILPHVPAALRLLKAGRQRTGLRDLITTPELIEVAFTMAAVAWGARQKEPA